MIFIIDDDELMAKCVERATRSECLVFGNAIEAMSEIADGKLPNLIFLDILLDGPDGFTFLNELASYTDTEKIPVVIFSSINFSEKDFSEYGVVGVLSKDTMTPQEIKGYVEKYT